MIMKVIYPDNSWIVGKRGYLEQGTFLNHETKGTHHFTMLDGSDRFKDYIGMEVAVPIDRVDLFVLNFKDGGKK